MEILNKLTDNTILITPNSVKEQILVSLNKKDKILNIKFMTLEEIRNNYYFEYDEKALLFIMDNYKLNVDISRVIINLLYFIDDKKYIDPKLQFLQEVKTNLDKHNLLIYNKMFRKFIKNKNLICYGYPKLNKFNSYLLNEINCNTIYEEHSNIKRKVNVFNTLEEEVEFVFIEISKLINDGIDINNICLCGITDEYTYTLKKYSKLFNIPLEFSESIYSSEIVKNYLKVLLSSKSFSDALCSLEQSFNLSKEENAAIYNILLNISNKYNDLDYKFENIYKLVVDDIKNISINKNKLSNSIGIKSIGEPILDNEYVFMLGFNQEIIPRIFSDEDYLTDIEKKENNLLIETSIEKNILFKKITIDFINSINNLTITAKEESISKNYLISNLANELDYEIVRPNIECSTIYSLAYAKLKLAKCLDDYIKYGIVDRNLKLLYNNINIDYLTYDNRFSGIDTERLLDKLKNGLILSYTHVDNYYHCAFKYYLTNILKLDKFENNFNTTIGSLFHYILSICFSDNFGFSYEYDKYIGNIDLNAMEKFLLIKLKNELEVVINNVKKLHKETGLTNMLLEHKISIDKSTIIPVKFTGVVDKIMYKEKENTLVSIVDYKTGHTKINLYNVLYGLSMQLPIYLYLVEKSKKFKNVRFTGFYLQQILFGEITYVPNKTYQQQKEQNLKLDGYSNDDTSILEVFIPDYEDSNFVKSMKITSKGFGPYSKVLSDSQIFNLVDFVDVKINDARDKILEGKFDINPKQIGDEKIGCDYCKFRDICFRTNDDFVKLKENKSLSFLGGDDNA